MTKSDTITLIEAETLLLVHEDTFERFRRLDFGSFQANFTQAPSQFGCAPSKTNSNGRRSRGGKVL
ncbi:hypothetical protein AHAS_Ahas03G0216200 [Arachis hypogaea]